MRRVPIAVAPTGAANLASVLAGLRRAGGAPRVASSPRELERAPYAVLPGVGAFAPARERLRERGFDTALAERFAAARPTLAICLGLQLLFEGSAEGGGVEGLGLAEGEIAALPAAPRLPQIGWNTVDPESDCALLEPGHAYYANSYACRTTPRGWRVARSEYGVSFLAAIERGPWLACQFHPELSSAWGNGLLRRWLCRGGETSC